MLNEIRLNNIEVVIISLLLNISFNLNFVIVEYCIIFKIYNYFYVSIYLKSYFDSGGM